MSKFIFSTLFLSMLLMSCNTESTPKKETVQNRTSDWVPEPDIQLRLQADKQIVDSTLIKTKEGTLKYIQIEGEKSPKLVNSSNEEENETEYYIYKDSTNEIKAILELPASKSGDWYLETRHYFDKNGQIYAFQKQLSTFHNDGCGKDGVITANTIEIFNNGKLIEKTTIRRDAKGVEIKDENCKYYDMEIPIYVNLLDWSKATKIDLSSQVAK